MSLVTFNINKFRAISNFHYEIWCKFDYVILQILRFFLFIYLIIEIIQSGQFWFFIYFSTYVTNGMLRNQYLQD